MKMFKTILSAALFALFAVSAQAVDFGVGQGSSAEAITQSTVGGLAGSLGNGLSGNVSGTSGNATAWGTSSLTPGTSTSAAGATQNAGGFVLGGSLGSAAQGAGYTSTSGGLGQASAGWSLQLP